jgi:hypothetical protein
MKKNIPLFIKALLDKFGITSYYKCCDVCNIRCCNGTTVLTIDGVDYDLITTGVPTLQVRIA